jgi:hypothetical protein
VSRLFLLSPAHCGGERARLLFDPRARFDLARRLHAGPEPTLTALNEVRRLILNAGGARMFATASAATQKELGAGLQELAGRLETAPVKKAVYGEGRRVDRRLAQREHQAGREDNAAHPVFVGLLNANSQGGVFLNSAPLASYHDTSRDKILDYLATNLYAGGSFTTAGGLTANYIAKWDGSSWTALGSGMDNVVAALAVSGSDLYAGGYFGTAGGKVSPYIARASLLTLPMSPPTLSLVRSGANLIFTWPTNSTGFTLQSTTTLVSPVVWTANSPAPIVVNGQNTVTDPVFGPQKFYRLIQ